MNVQDFILKLASRYNGSNEQKIEDVKNWIERNNIKDYQLDTIDILIQEQYNKTSFPLIKDLIDLYSNGYTTGGKQITDDIYYPEKFVNHITSKMNIDKIVKNYICIEQKKRNEDKELTTFENYFLYIFDDLIYNVRARKGKYTEQQNKEKAEQELEMIKKGFSLDLEEVEHNLDVYNEIANKYKKVS